MAVARDDILEAGRRIESCLNGLEVTFSEDGFVARERGADSVFGKRVDAGIEQHSIGEFAAIGFCGESDKENDYSPAIVSLLPKDRWELGSFLRFAIGAAFNMELKAGFMDD